MMIFSVVIFVYAVSKLYHQNLQRLLPKWIAYLPYVEEESHEEEDEEEEEEDGGGNDDYDGDGSKYVDENDWCDDDNVNSGEDEEEEKVEDKQEYEDLPATNAQCG